MAEIYRNKFALPPLPPSGSFTNKHILITGGTSGLGLASAVHFINLGAPSVTITGRTLASASAAKLEIEKQTGTSNIVKIRELDQSTLSSSAAFAEALVKDEEKLDIIVLNAGCYMTKFEASTEGFEMGIQVNVLGTTLLALLLLPWLKKVSNGTGHLCVVSSGVHREVPLSTLPQTDVLGFYSKPENFPTGKVDIYYISKLLLQYCVREVAALAEGKVVVNPLCPGMVKSNLARHHKTNAAIGLVADIFMTLCCKTAEGGARTVIKAALSEENGLMVAEVIFSPEGEKMQKQVWNEVLAILSKVRPEVMEVAKSA
ncbi:NAD(P)-binding Rossmann-fold containing protein [Glarea lozoyensis ATCC 20868]|uniref:NAD(P)-binding Rossmann-fold containing protein n=1 Tax=Glarea lozoyensis (strain ATCC 20868 / MF5171) TaxID=1116229 RepID=S3CLH5_GLAL2|nr:NAD(P)-binding Rossmann-fold containing protein [Glarea lozoyensis ATCC 20868]EPE27322.1 NAD(P)-binding Rossmann-fold containing protein [Glarea lozoyensis ATCC 20868]